MIFQKRLIIVPDVPTSSGSRDAATAQNNNNDSNDQGGIVLFGFFNDWGHLLVHDFFSSYGMMNDVMIISGSLSVRASVQPVDDECSNDNKQCTDQHGQEHRQNG